MSSTHDLEKVEITHEMFRTQLVKQHKVRAVHGVFTVVPAC